MFIHGNSESVISVLSVKCTISESVIVIVPTERDQADGAKLLLTRTETQAHPAPLICKRVYFLPKLIHLTLKTCKYPSVGRPGVKSKQLLCTNWAVCCFTASQERLR